MKTKSKTKEKALKPKSWTDKQISRLPKEGYWLSIYEAPIKNDGTYISTTLYCIMNGYIKYIREDVMCGQSEGYHPEWVTLLWTCMPTERMINNPEEYTTYYHYETIEEVIKYNPTLSKKFHTKAPNDLK